MVFVLYNSNIIIIVIVHRYQSNFIIEVYTRVSLLYTSRI